MQILIEILSIVLQLVVWIIIVQIVLSWLLVFNVINTSNEFVRQFIHSLNKITEPIYRPIRRVLPDFGMIDLSPMIVLLVIFILQNSILPRLYYAF